MAGFLLTLDNVKIGFIGINCAHLGVKYINVMFANQKELVD